MWGSYFSAFSCQQKILGYLFCLTCQVNRDELHRQFYNLGVGAIEEVRVQQEKGFGFVRYSTHGEAALAIQMANGLVVRGKPLKVTSKENIYFPIVIFIYSLHDCSCISFGYPVVLVGQ
jgi:hypothetical protein